MSKWDEETWLRDGRLRQQYEATRWVNPDRRREKSEWPYSYDEFFIFGSRETIRGALGNYSDRLWEWDPKKYETLWKKHVGKNWAYATAGELSAFMSEYEGKPKRVVALAEGCNPSNGYPYFIVWTRDVE